MGQIGFDRIDLQGLWTCLDWNDSRLAWAGACWFQTAWTGLDWLARLGLDWFGLTSTRIGLVSSGLPPIGLVRIDFALERTGMDWNGLD